MQDPDSNGPTLGDALNKKSLAQQVYEVLESLIISGKLAPGSRLAEETFAKQLTVSRSPVREAIAELQRVGLAERSAFHDRRVLVPTHKFVSDFYDLWIVLQSSQIYLSSQSATKEDIAAISQVMTKMKAARASKAQYSELARKFSKLLTKGCDNLLLNNILESHGKYLRWLASVYYSGEAETPEESHKDHLLIFRKFCEKDLTGLVTSVKHHVDKQRDMVLQKLTGGERAKPPRKRGAS